MNSRIAKKALDGWLPDLPQDAQLEALKRLIVTEGGADVFVLPVALQVLRSTHATAAQRDAALDLLSQGASALGAVVSEAVEAYVAGHLNALDRARLRQAIEPHRRAVVGKALQLYAMSASPYALELLLWSDSDEGDGMSDLLEQRASEQGSLPAFRRDARLVFVNTGYGGAILERAVEDSDGGMDPIATVDVVGEALEAPLARFGMRSAPDTPPGDVCRYATWLQRVHARNAGTKLGDRVRVRFRYAAAHMPDEWFGDCVPRVDQATIVRALVGVRSVDAVERREILKCIALAASPWEGLAYDALHEGDYDGTSVVLSLRKGLQKVGLHGVPILVASVCGHVVSAEEVADDRLLLGDLAGLLRANTGDVLSLLHQTFPPSQLEAARQYYVELLGVVLQHASRAYAQERALRHVKERRSGDSYRLTLIESLMDYQCLRQELGLPLDAKAAEWIAVHEGRRDA